MPKKKNPNNPHHAKATACSPIRIITWLMVGMVPLMILYSFYVYQRTKGIGARTRFRPSFVKANHDADPEFVPRFNESLANANRIEKATVSKSKTRKNLGRSHAFVAPQNFTKGTEAKDLSGSSARFKKADGHAKFPIVGGLELPRVPQSGPIVRGLGSELSGEKTQTHLHGVVGTLSDGSPSWRPLPALDWSKETMAEKERRHNHTCFNLRHSDALPLDRPIPDTRDGACAGRTYDYSSLPDTTVVFVFYNEPISPLLRSIHSVLNRSPPQLLKEIVLIDDGSDAPWVGKELEKHISRLPKVSMKRIRRSGLMVARTEGALMATAETVTFLDTHIEVNEQWLEPLMARIAENARHVVMPLIDSIDPDSFVYKGGGIDILGFSWILGQSGVFRGRAKAKPMSSPIMAGGLFAIKRKAFYDIGTYDQGMRLYGGEEMEISFRIWQCGYTLECIPCSRVGHIFRTGRYWHGQVYKVPGSEITRNKLRAAAVWMDSYAKIVQLSSPKLPKSNPLGDLSAMRAIRKELKCKSFQWYLDNVYPEMKVPHNIEGFKKSGAILQGHTCFDTLSPTPHVNKPIGLYPCHFHHGTQAFLLSSTNEIRISVGGFQNCVTRKGSSLIVDVCKEVGGDQKWDYDDKTGQLSQMVDKSRQCITVRKRGMEVSKCDRGSSDSSQEWRWKD